MTWTDSPDGRTANSPCTNKNDLGFYNSIDSRLPKLRNFNLDELYKQVEDEFWAYPSEKLDALARMKACVCQAIIAAGRGRQRL